jgi:hypothetical protein
MALHKQHPGQQQIFQKGKQGRYGKRQHGFVLILALVMLAVLTLIGVSSMNSASLELRAAANAQQHVVAFNGVQSVLEFVLSQPAEDIIDWTSTNVGLVQTATHALPSTLNLVASVTYVGCSKGIGSSLQAGRGLSYSFFSVAGSGTNATGTATSLQTQGVRYPAASC